MLNQIKSEIADLESTMEKTPPENHKKLAEISQKLAVLYEKLLAEEGRQNAEEWDRANPDHPYSIYKR